MVLSIGLWLSQRGQVAQALADAALLAQLDWRPGLWPTQPWPLWTAALVHWSDAHLVVNLLACSALIAWGNAAALGNRQTLAWLAAWPVTHVLLAGLAPLERYGGLSGVLHAGVAIGAWTLVWRGQGQRRVVGIDALIADTASPRAAPCARLKLMVTDGNMLWWLIDSG
jgi:hypothetical protein